ncbi:glycosyltransferase family 4 protein [Butyrivibrio sp. INlla14]|uniref:glycosyltransferase family 4 protein n=1 Tax=Butyrivibrio sp. INlla14 TaxID=1520808 RepID=UPI000877491D|nr:glycosyltransferase family 4 protein [Butyrivibrio sp. INlla14]SCY72665.1 Glycosyltransferase involved in cell wall bisynthesis [Butyrivibrio sp. INlla14]
MKVLFITNVPFPYTVDYLSELGKKCELVACFERATSSERDKSWAEFELKNCKAIIMKGINIGVEAALCFEVIRHINEEKADIVLISNPCTPTGIIAQLYMKIHNIRYCIQSEGAFVGKGWGPKEQLKLLTMKNATMYFSTGKCQDDYFLKYGAKLEQIRRFPFTTLWDNEIKKKIVSREKKDEIKKKLNIKEDSVILCVGQFIPRKGIDILLKSISDVDGQVRTLIIGGKPTEEYLSICEEKNLKNVTFIHHISKEQLKEYYDVADIFVLPTNYDTWGLVIVEAMSYGVPVITTDSCVAACTLIDNGVNGYALKAGDVDAFSNTINAVIGDKELLQSMGQKALEMMQGYSIENMAYSIMKGLNELTTIS